MDVNEASKVLSDAWQAVETSKVPAQIQEAAFVEAVQLLADSPPTSERGGRQGEGTGGATGPAKAATPAKRATTKTPASSGQSDTDDAPSEHEFYENLVRHTHVEREIVEDLLHYSNDKITINVTGRALGATLRQKQQVAGILLSVAYQYGLGHTTTSVSVIREECTRLRALDHNLPTYLRNTDGIRLVGDGRVKNIQLRDAALDRFKTEAERIAGKSEAAE
ncbi:hypothetical protein [Mycobacterium marseillense]|uniref:hypothetical protein n=1 Tax=Mycobacterium marseillense TaxID=701042 RepID=UPI0011A4A0DA|nr:hypothetical protein [Mycobacterium marseillense]